MLAGPRRRSQRFIFFPARFAHARCAHNVLVMRARGCCFVGCGSLRVSCTFGHVIIYLNGFLVGSSYFPLLHYLLIRSHFSYLYFLPDFSPSFADGCCSLGEAKPHRRVFFFCLSLENTHSLSHPKSTAKLASSWTRFLDGYQGFRLYFLSEVIAAGV